MARASTSRRTGRPSCAMRRRPRSCRASGGSTQRRSSRRPKPIDLVTEADNEAERVIKARGRPALARGAVRRRGVGGGRSGAARPLAGRRACGGRRSGGRHRQFRRRPAAVRGHGGGGRKGETVAGIIYDPMGDDWVMAEKGGGAWLRRPDGRHGRLQVGARRAARPRWSATCSIGFPARRQQAAGAGQSRQGPDGGQLSLSPATNTACLPAAHCISSCSTS